MLIFVIILKIHIGSSVTAYIDYQDDAQYHVYHFTELFCSKKCNTKSRYFK